MIGRPTGRALLLGAVVAAVLVVVGAALMVLDSPAEERRKRLDGRRVDDLHEIAEAVDAYWSRKGALPPDLETLEGWEGFDLPRSDPETEEPYEYRTTGEATYELCATFATEAPGEEAHWARRGHRLLWHHPEGEHCFELEAEEVER